jgi:hydrogenase-4 component F
MLLVAFAAIGVAAAAVLLGPPAAGAETDGAAPLTLHVGTRAATAPLVAGLVALAIIGVLAWPLQELLRTAAAIGAPS